MSVINQLDFTTYSFYLMIANFGIRSSHVQNAWLNELVICQKKILIKYQGGMQITDQNKKKNIEIFS
jgi:hypothetical protein